MQAWEQFLQLQEEELGAETVQKWLRTLKIQRFDACNLYLEAKDSFQALWFEEHIRSKAQSSLVNGNHKKIKIHLSIASAPALSKKTKEKKQKISPPLLPQFQLVFDELDPHCFLDNFFISNENQLTLQFLREVSDLSSTKESGSARIGFFNPIYLHGSNGSGKTHVLMALTQALRKQGLKTLYVRADTFTDHVVTAIRAGQMSVFRQAYRNIDVLIIDDIHVFSRRGATQEEFFHTFNTLHINGKQIILGANCSPQELQLIEPRLVSRFEWGIVLPLYSIKGADLKHLLNIKTQALNFSLPPQIAEFLLETFTSNPKALIRALEALILRLHLDTRHPLSALNLLAVKTILSDLIVEEQKLALNPSKIIQAVSEYYDIRIEEMMGKTQSRECALPRQVAMHFCRYQLKMPFMKIGDLFSRDHSTVMSSVKQIQKALDENERELTSAWHSISKKLQTL